MSRSLKKGPYIDEKLMKKVGKLRAGDQTAIRTWSRSCVIVPEMVGFTFEVHNGKDFIIVQAREDMVGHKLGEFASTTKFVRHGGKMQREIESQAKPQVAAAAPVEKKIK
jgi:small subunit ribosomal protein S19